MKEQEKTTIEGVIERKETNQKSGPKCFFYIQGDKYTCWSETFMSKFDEGDYVVLSYVESKNEFNGRTYINKNVQNMEFKDKGVVSFSPSQREVLEESGVKVDKLQSPPLIIKSDNGKIKLGGIYYRIKDIELELIQN